MTERVDTPQSRLPDKASLTRLVEQALDQARTLGATAAEASVRTSQGLSVKCRQGNPETLEHVRDRGLGITVYRGTRKGSASTSDTSEAAVRETVAAACEMARHTSEDPAAGLPDPALLASEPPDLALDHAWAIDAEDAIAMAQRCEAAASAVDRRLTNSEGAGVVSQRAIQVYGNTAGFLDGFATSQHALSCAMLAEADGRMQRDHWFAVARDPSELASVEAVGRRAGERAVARLGARRVATGTYPVLFDPMTARSLIGHFVAAVSGRALYRRASFLMDCLGEQVFSPGIDLNEYPHTSKALGSAPFDAEGVATRSRSLVADGCLEGLVLDSYAGRRLGRPTTGNADGVHNLTLAPGHYGFDELVAGMERGLVVTQLMGQGVNLVTGDYSRGAAGFWVEQGRIVHPVEEITVAGNLAAMFRNIAAVGHDVDTRGTICTGSVLVDGMTVAGD